MTEESGEFWVRQWCFELKKSENESSDGWENLRKLMICGKVD